MGRALAILAGTGSLVGEVVAAAIGAGDRVRVFALVPQETLPGVDTVSADPRDPERLLADVAAFGASHVVMAGGLMLTDQMRERLGGLTGASALGDAALSQFARTLIARSGAQLIGVHEVSETLLAASGHIAGPPVTEATLTVAAFALGVAREIGRLDLGQAVVVSGSRVVAAEDVAGTDELMRRVGRYREQGLLGGGTSTLLLAKAKKPQQPMHVDLPAIGVDTVRTAAEAGISVIAVEAGRTLVLSRTPLVEAARSHGVSVIGLAGDD
ncbi:UDP-2,3-diacylglucosamine diphosphatase LpxI domain-containing protein [Devosia sp.]|uniref:UDP-2,3-diacylglucosamine diphosphatase LpxI domain-containing protein n=1 Tax=Devosia sp. TaxID=1871048 RepID=UPI003BACFEF5